MKNLKFFFFSITVISIISCSKYDDNTGLNLQSKNKRLIGEWELVYFKKVTLNGIEEIVENGTYTFTSSAQQFSYPYIQSITLKDEGYYEAERIWGANFDTSFVSNTWSWVDGKSKKEMLRMNGNNSLGLTETYIIKKLTKSELNLEYNYSSVFSSGSGTGNSGEFRFKKK